MQVLGPDLFEAAWIAFSSNASHQLALTTPTEVLAASLPALNLALEVLISSKSEVVADRGQILANESVKAAVRGIEQDVLGERSVPLLSFVLRTRVLVERDEETQATLSSLASEHVPNLLTGGTTSKIALSLLTAHLSSSTLATETRSTIWSRLFAQSPSDTVLLGLIECAQDGDLSAAGQLPSAGIEDRILRMAERLLISGPADDKALQMQIVKRLLLQPGETMAMQTVPSLSDSRCCRRTICLFRNARSCGGIDCQSVSLDRGRILARRNFVRHPQSASPTDGACGTLLAIRS